MNKSFAKLGVIFIVVGFTTSALAIDVPLIYKKFPEKFTSFYPRSILRLTMVIKSPSGEWKIPELKSKYPLYTFIKIGDKDRLCILDRQNSDDIFYNRIYFDSNANQDLKDDPIINGTLNQRSDQRCHVEFPSVDTLVDVDGKSLPYSFRPYAYTYRLDAGKDIERKVEPYVNFWLWVNCSYSGEFQINSQNYSVILGDIKVNGRFNDKFSLRSLPGYTRMQIYAQGDHLYLTSRTTVNSFDGQILGDLLVIKDKLFKISISTAENKLTLTPITEDLAFLKLPVWTEHLSLQTEDKEHFLNIYHPDNKIMVPKGKYRLISYQVLRNDEQDDLWRLCAAGTTETPFFSVGEAIESSVEYGEPYIPFIKAYSRGGISRGIALSLNIEGQGKEFLTDLSRISGNQTRFLLSEKIESNNRPKEPSFKILDSEGKVVHQGSFKYG